MLFKMTTSLDEFFEHPTEESFYKLSKKQLLEVAEKYEIIFTTKEKSLKEGVVFVVKTALIDLGILVVSESGVTGDQGEKVVPVYTLSSLSFEEQKELLLLEMEKSRISQEVELRKLDIESQRFALIREGKMGCHSGNLQASIVSPAPKVFDVSRSLNLMPKFDEDDLDTFFTLFEQLADLMGWEDYERTLLLQCVFCGKAQKAYSTLCS